MTTKKTDSPLSRWSQRKMLVQEGKIPADPPTDLASEPDVELQSTLQGEQIEQLDEKGELQQASVPAEDEIDHEKFADVDFDALNYDSDYTQFMAKNVPEFVKRRALRALWNSDPILANIDGLNDYDEDFTIVEPISKTIASAWNMGKGYMTAEEEEEQKKIGQDVEIAADDDVDSLDEAIDSQETDDQPDADTDEAQAPADELEEKLETS